jgi:hypothetical protein
LEIGQKKELGLISDGSGLIGYRPLAFATVKTPGRQAVSGSPTFFFIRKLRNYLESFGFYSAIAIVLHRFVATTS